MDSGDAAGDAIGAVLTVLAQVGVPIWILIVVGGTAVLLFGVRAWPLLRRALGRVEPAPPPISDGAAAADRLNPPARPGFGGPPVISDGGSAGDPVAPAQPTSGERGGGPTGGSG